jgi:hypothetical protein
MKNEFIQDNIHMTSLAPSLPHSRVIASKNSLNAFGQDLRERKIDECTHEGMISHNYSKAHHMTDIFKDIHSSLVAHQITLGVN